jgi:hypothetical protein
MSRVSHWLTRPVSTFDPTARGVRPQSHEPPLITQARAWLRAARVQNETNQFNNSHRAVAMQRCNSGAYSRKQVDGS